MTEFEKLKHRLSHAGKNTTEYRMTIIEATNLVDEFEELRKKQENPQDKEVVVATTPRTRILDGGHL